MPFGSNESCSSKSALYSARFHENAVSTTGVTCLQSLNKSAVRMVVEVKLIGTDICKAGQSEHNTSNNSTGTTKRVPGNSVNNLPI